MLRLLFRVHFLFLVLMFPALLCGQEKSIDEQSVDAISHPEGLDVSLWAGSDQLSNPVAFTFDNQGRMFLCETFRQNKGVEDNRGHMDWLDDDLAAQSLEDRLAYFKHHLGDELAAYEAEEDRITVISDEDGDGRADKDWVFADGFSSALTGTGAGVLVLGNDVYYTCIPDLWKITDADGDGLSDQQQSLHYGYGVRVAFRGHDSHGLVLGPDGRIYFSIGDRGYNIRTKDGRELKDPESGAVFRCELDGSGLEVFATGLRNPQELIFDTAGNLFTGDNNSDSGDEARWVHVVEGSETGWRMAFQYLSDRGPWNREKLWHPRHEGQAAYIVPPIVNFADGPSGVTYYPGTGLGKKYNGTFFLCDFRGDASISGVRSFKLKPAGASFEMTQPDKFLWNVLATDIEFGPDGGLYATDWIEGWEGVNRGRVVRITNPKLIDSKQVKNVQALLAMDMTQEKPGKLVPRLGNPDRRVRMKTQLELARREAVGFLARVAKNSSKKRLARMHAIWGLGHVARKTTNARKRRTAVAVLPELMTAKDPWLRAAVVTVMGDLGDREFAEPLQTALQDEDLRVRSLAAIAIGKTGAEQVVDSLVSMIADNNDQDVVLRHAGVMGLLGAASEAEVTALSADTRRSVRLAAVLVLRRMKSPQVAEYLSDADPLIVLEAARAIHDMPISDAMPTLAGLIHSPTRDEALLRRVLNANYRMGGAEQATAVASVLRADVPDVFKLEAIDMLGHWETPSNRDRVLGMWRPLESRSADPAREAIRQVLLDGDAVAAASTDVKANLIELAANLGLEEIVTSVRQSIGNSEFDPTQRANMLSSLVALDGSMAIGDVTNSLQDASAVVRSRARELLLELDPKRGVKELRDVLTDGQTIERQSAWAALSSMGEAEDTGVRTVLKELDLESVPADTRLDVVEAARRLGMDEVASRMLKPLQDLPYGERHLTVLGGDPARGEEIFRNNVALSCLRCHSVGDSGGNVGPNLAGIGKTKTADYLLESIMDPNKQIAEGFGTLIVVTDDGLQYQGLVQKEADDLIHMIDADGNRFHIVKEEIIARKNGKSAMPEELTKSLTNFQLRDLIAYLVSLKTPWVKEAGHEE